MSEGPETGESGQIEYRCHACSAAISAPLSAARTNKACPSCGVVGEVPLPRVSLKREGGRRGGARWSDPAVETSGAGDSPSTDPKTSSGQTGSDGGGKRPNGGGQRRGPGHGATGIGGRHGGAYALSSNQLTEHAAVFFVFIAIGFGLFQLFDKSEEIPELPGMEVVEFGKLFDWSDLGLERDVEFWTPRSSADVYERIKLITRRIDAANANINEIKQLETAIEFGNLPASTEQAARQRVEEFKAELVQDAEYASDAFRAIVEANYTAPQSVEEAFAEAIEITQSNGSFQTKAVVEDIRDLAAQNTEGGDDTSFLEYWGRKMQSQGEAGQQ